MTVPVYLVDDDDAVRRALGLLLSTVGIKVIPFADPQAFLGQLSRLEPGCLILDIRMPAISGLKLQEKLRENGVDWPTIVISGHGDIEACRRAFRNGALTPRELVREAARRGLRVLAITDHDSTDGLPDALDEASRLPPLTIVPGLEINCDVAAPPGGRERDVADVPVPE